MGVYELKGREIVDMDIDELVKALNSVLADEMLAFNEYLICSKVIKGPMRVIVKPKLKDQADEELEHAKKIMDRVTQLGGTPILNPNEWHDLSNCGYNAPEKNHVWPILQQTKEKEEKLINEYEKLKKKVHGKDYITHKLLLGILEDELKHEENLNDFIEDMEIMGYRHDKES